MYSISSHNNNGNDNINKRKRKLKGKNKTVRQLDRTHSAKANAVCTKEHLMAYNFTISSGTETARLARAHI
jgi:hypothetical protein